MNTYEAAQSYLHSCERRTDNELTNTNRARLLSAFVSWMENKTLDEDLLPQYRRHLSQAISARTHAPLTVGTQAQLLRQAKAFCKWLSAKHMISTDITTDIPSIKQSHGHRRDALDAASVQTILDAITGDTLQDQRDKLAITLAVVAGLRCCELSRLKCGDLIAVGSSCAVLVHGKGHSDADTLQPIPRPLWQQLAAFADQLHDHRAGDPLLPSFDRAGHGRSVTAAGWSRIIKSRLSAAGFSSARLTAHSLRHSAVTIGLESGATLTELQQFARHADISTTTIYTHERDRMTSPVPGAIWMAITGSDHTLTVINTNQHTNITNREELSQ